MSLEFIAFAALSYLGPLCYIALVGFTFYKYSKKLSKKSAENIPSYSTLDKTCSILTYISTFIIAFNVIFHIAAQLCDCTQDFGAIIIPFVAIVIAPFISYPGGIISLHYFESKKPSGAFFTYYILALFVITGTALFLSTIFFFSP